MAAHNGSAALLRAMCEATCRNYGATFYESRLNEKDKNGRGVWDIGKSCCGAVRVVVEEFWGVQQLRAKVCIVQLPLQLFLFLQRYYYKFTSTTIASTTSISKQTGE